MLVLSRKTQETIVIDGGRIVVKVLSAKGKAVRIGIQADADISIRRGELAPEENDPVQSEPAAAG
jgi:carbon storage regulator CsrA